MPNLHPQFHGSGSAMAAPTISAHGLPVAFDAAEFDASELDCRMFALYFLVTETLTTYVGYRITQHCLRGRGLYMLSPTLRTCAVILYCAAKIKVIDYAFHGSLYLIVSAITAFCFTLCTLLAIAFHFGPMQFVFADFRRKQQKPTASSSPLRHLVNELKCFFLKQHFHEYARELAATQAHHATQGAICSTVSTAPLTVRVPLLIGSVALDVAQWNDWFVKHSVASLSKTAAAKATPSTLVEGMCEARFIVLIHASGLLVNINFAKWPTASLMVRLHRDDAYPFELVVRLLRTTSGRSDVYYYFAQSPQLVGPPSVLVKRSIFSLLVQLNAAAGHRVDVLLRALQCKSFTSVQCGQEVAFKRTRPRSSSLSSRLESAFG